MSVAVELEFEQCGLNTTLDPRSLDTSLCLFFFSFSLFLSFFDYISTSMKRPSEVLPDGSLFSPP